MTGRNLVVFSDGTGNSAAKVFKTNVWRLYEALDLNGPDQLAFYDDGVGTASFPVFAVLGGAFGWGLKRNVLDLYRFVSRNYREGDRIFAFGFSRGAFTIRVLSGLIATQGLIRNAEGAELKRLAAWAYRAYRKRYNQTKGLVGPLRKLRDGLLARWDSIWKKQPYDRSKNADVTITFLGLFDTVAAYGLPFDELTRGWDYWIWPLSVPNQDLSRKVEKAYHALALDDERQTFHPLLWNETPESANATSAHVSQERISQVWFAGVHSNVGGGYPDDSLACTPLCWVAAEAARLGLRFMPHLCGPNGKIPQGWLERASPCATMHDSRRGPGAYYRYAPRRIEGLRKDIDGKVLVPRPKIHTSAFERIRASNDGYAPIVLPEKYAIVDREGNICEGPDSPLRNPYEHPTQSLSRSLRQEEVWNDVWWRRAAYFATVAFTLIVLLIPAWPRSNAIDTFGYALPLMSAGVAFLGSFLPGFLSGWVAHYQKYPLQLLIGMAAVAVLMRIGGGLQQRITDRMRQVWKSNDGIRATETGPVDTPDDFLYRLRTSPRYFRFFRAFSKYIWPQAFGFSMFCFIAGGIPIGLMRLTFDVASVTGFVCRDGAGRTSSSSSSADRWTLAFRPGTPCHATGIQIERDARYRVEVAVPGQPGGVWRDGALPIESPAGYPTSRQPRLYPVAPLRRVLQADWFVPIARVGHTGAEHHPLTEPITVFTAQRDGELILFVNELIAPWPWNRFYRNNSGDAACIRVTKLQPNEPSERLSDVSPRCEIGPPTQR